MTEGIQHPASPLITLTLVNGNLETAPVLVTSTAATIYFTSTDRISVYVGNTPDTMMLYKDFSRNDSFGSCFNNDFNQECIEVTDLAIGSYVKIVSETPLSSATLRWKGEEALLLTPYEVSMLARPVYSDEQKMLRYIYEAEQNNLKPAMGDDAYLRAKRNMTAETDMLLKGGTYTDEDGRERHFAGLKRALAYYTYSRLVESSNIELTRQGVVNRRSDYSDEADRQERIEASRETYAIADRYLKECLAYLAFIDGASCREDDVNSNRTKIKIIGR